MASEFPKDTIGQPPAGGGGMIGRIQRLLLKPNEEWPVIEAEPKSAQQVFMTWAVPLAAIGPICTLIGYILFLHAPISVALVMAVLVYAGALVGVWVLAFIFNMLAPSFGGTKSMDQAMKVAAYSYTPAWLAAVLGILPALGIIGSLLGLYSLYLLWLGLPRLMKVPADKAPGYVIVSILCAIVFAAIIGAIIGAVIASMMMAAMGGAMYGLR